VNAWCAVPRLRDHAKIEIPKIQCLRLLLIHAREYSRTALFFHARQSRLGNNNNYFFEMESKKFDAVNDEKLIEMVRDYPVLYKSSDKNYKDNNIKGNVWREISIVIGNSGKSNAYQCCNVNNM